MCSLTELRARHVVSFLGWPFCAGLSALAFLGRPFWAGLSRLASLGRPLRLALGWPLSSVGWPLSRVLLSLQPSILKDTSPIRFYLKDINPKDFI